MTERARTSLLAAAVLLLAGAAPAVCAAAEPDVALAVRAGTPGVGLDLDLGLSPSFGVRVGFSGFDLDHSIATSDVNYDGRLKLRTVTGLLDWYVLRGSLHLTAGVAGNGTKLEVVGQPGCRVNCNIFPTSELGPLSGELEFGNAVSPYVGFGWGNPAGASSRVHWLFDVGAIYGGTPRVTLTEECGPDVPASICSQARSDLAPEEAQLRDKADILRWYPVVNLGVAVRF